MLEEFISVALEAFAIANGDADKFELHLRRKLMTYNTVTLPQQVTEQQSISMEQVDKVISSLNVTDPIFDELENVDINNMTDAEILAFAQKMGLMNPEENE